MTSEECREILVHTGFGHLGCTRNDEPYVVPIYFVYEQERLYGFSTFGRKIEWMRANPKVCIEVDEVASHFSWASVIINGRYQELPNTPLHSSARQHAYSLLEKRTLWWQTAQAARELRTAQPFPPIFFCIRVDAMSGHRSVADDPAECARPVIRVRD
jgi:nitroimidazol reductase NimA-like FMN-containing flavoprotein (pyridoxamine 5'-phosphate oxidase superfamily)